MMKKTVRKFSKSGIMKTDVNPGWRPMHGACGLLKSSVCCSRAIFNSTFCLHDGLIRSVIDQRNRLGSAHRFGGGFVPSRRRASYRPRGGLDCLLGGRTATYECPENRFMLGSAKPHGGSGEWLGPARDHRTKTRRAASVYVAESRPTTGETISPCSVRPRCAPGDPPSPALDRQPAAVAAQS